uniref:Sigma 54 modulation/S30EA ribosomal protein C-terminal domain-containing protein n=1 Tax=Rhodosorus marinus TaxID=101924 RepID=A0A7S3EHB5_9RHOD|mmetsp:Transcript_36341/g.145284  ORF Transcript_36341/g.145284 Transcript_36341/m.145284 type:complete len:246 (+) Transcript_36341:143-880(+)
MGFAFVGLGSTFVGGRGDARAVSPLRRVRAQPVRQTARTNMTAVSPESATKINVTGNNIDLTDSLRNYVQEKIGKSIQKYLQFITKVDVHLSVAHNPSIKHAQAAEVVVFAVGTVMRAEVKMENAYSSIDLVADKISRKLRKYKERKERSKDRSKEKTSEIARRIAESEEELEEEVSEDVKTPDLREIVKVKEFQMPAQTVEDAALCLEYIDHDFYVFRDSETNEINVLYKRNHGGLGLIKPEKA